MMDESMIYETEVGTYNNVVFDELDGCWKLLGGQRTSYFDSHEPASGWYPKRRAQMPYLWGMMDGE